MLLLLACVAEGVESKLDSPETVDPPSCDEVDAFVPVYPDTIATWSAQDAIGGWPADATVFVGSSSMRRWASLAATYPDYAPIQRGFGGAQLGEVAQSAEALINVHDPRAVVVYAGANDVAAGVDAATVLERFRCLRSRVPPQTPLLFIGITPNPARWSTWDVAAAVNAAVVALAEADASVVYIDTATPFLATGEPPDASLFVEDGLHLTASGYALWDSVIHPAVAATVAPLAPEPVTPLASGTRILLDLGPSNAGDGELSPSPDHLGQSWNNWFPIEGDTEILPGEQIVDLVSSTGVSTPVDFVVSGGFSCNGRSNGGLLWPDEALLGGLAVGSATGDYFYMTGDDEDLPGAFFFRGLDPSARYRLRIFAGRDDAEVRTTVFTVGDERVTLQTSGPGAAHDGGNGNDDDVAEFASLAPGAWGGLYVDVSIGEGTYAYVSAVELTVL